MRIEETFRQIATLNPAFDSKARGCSEEEIRGLEIVLKRELPPGYRQFLSKIGHDTAGLALYGAGFPSPSDDFSYAHVLKLAKSAKWALPARFTMIGVDQEDPYEDVYLDAEPQPDDPWVVRFDTSADPASITSVLKPHGARAVARSLSEMLLTSAVASYVFPKMRMRARLRHLERREGALDEIDRLLVKAGFRNLSRAKAWNRCYAKSDMAAIAFQDEARAPARIEVRSASAAQAKQLAAVLQERNGFGRGTFDEAEA